MSTQDKSMPTEKIVQLLCTERTYKYNEDTTMECRERSNTRSYLRFRLSSIFPLRIVMLLPDPLGCFHQLLMSPLRQPSLRLFALAVFSRTDAFGFFIHVVNHLPRRAKGTNFRAPSLMSYLVFGARGILLAE